jgi:hypothetical protein
MRFPHIDYLPEEIRAPESHLRQGTHDHQVHVEGEHKVERECSRDGHYWTNGVMLSLCSDDRSIRSQAPSST